MKRLRQNGELLINYWKIGKYFGKQENIFLLWYKKNSKKNFKFSPSVLTAIYDYYFFMLSPNKQVGGGGMTVRICFGCSSHIYLLLFAWKSLIIPIISITHLSPLFCVVVVLSVSAVLCGCCPICLRCSVWLLSYLSPLFCVVVGLSVSAVLCGCCPICLRCSEWLLSYLCLPRVKSVSNHLLLQNAGWH